MSIGKRIVKLRETKGWSQRELSRRVDLNPSVMNRIELGDRPIKDHELYKFADVLEVTADYLLSRTDDPGPKSSKKELTEKDEKDISKRIGKMKEDLQN